MLDPTDNKSSPEALPGLPVAPSPQRSAFARVFLGHDGIRAGWKVLLFFLLFAAIMMALHPLQRLHGTVGPHAVVPPGIALFDEFLGMVAVLLATAIMARFIDRKPWGYFGMPSRNAFRSSFWVGAAIGLGALALLLEIMHLGGWFDFGTMQLHGAAAVGYGIEWALMFLFVGVTEEGILRGYVQRVATDGLSNLRSGWSFWAAALIFSVMFGAGHLGNPGENKFGIFMVFVDGMAMCFSLWRTGDLWWAIGNHAAWDWGETFLFGTPNSGFVGQHVLMHPAFHGPLLLAGGTDGPEGSVLVLLCEAIFILSVAVIYRRRRFILKTEVAPTPNTPMHPAVDGGTDGFAGSGRL